MPLIPARLPGLAGVQDAFNRVGLNLKCSLLEGRSGSEFKPTVLAGQLEEISFITIDVDRRFFVTGTKAKERQSFFVVRSPGSAWFKGDTTQGNGDICGFQSTCNQTAAHWDGVAQCICLPIGSLEQHLSSMGAEPAVERMRKTNTLRVTSELYDSFCRLQRQGCMNELRDKSQIYNMLSIAIMVGTENPDTIVCRNWALVMEAVYAMHAALDGEPLSVKQLAGKLFTSESCINAACKQSFGCTVGRMMECARIAQAHVTLAKTSATVKQVMNLYGFTNSGRFAQKHQALFGVLPQQQLPLLKYDQGTFKTRQSVN